MRLFLFFFARGSTVVERLIHDHYKAKGAWFGRTPCDFCPRSHQEKYDLETCGGMEDVVEVVEAYLLRLGWSVDR